MSGISLLLAEVLSSGTYRFAVTMTIETPSTSWRTVSTGVVESAGCWAAVSARTAAVDTSDEAMKSSDGPQREPASQPTDRFMDPPFTSRAVAMPQQSAMLCRDPCQCRSDRVACHRNWAMPPPWRLVTRITCPRRAVITVPATWQRSGLWPQFGERRAIAQTATLHHGRDRERIGDIGQGISLEDDQIRVLPRLEAAKFDAATDVGRRADGTRAQGLGRRHAAHGVRLQFPVKSEPGHLPVGTDPDQSAGALRCGDARGDAREEVFARLAIRPDAGLHVHHKTRREAVQLGVFGGVIANDEVVLTLRSAVGDLERRGPADATLRHQRQHVRVQRHGREGVLVARITVDDLADIELHRQCAFGGRLQTELACGHDDPLAY